MHIEFGLKLKEYVTKARRRYYTHFVALLLVFFVTLVTLILVQVLTPFNFFTNNYVPVLTGSLLITYLLFMIIYLRLYYDRADRALLNMFYELAVPCELHLRRLQTGVKAYDYKKMLTEAQILYRKEFEAITSYEIDGKIVYILYFSKTDLDSIIIHLPDIKKQNYYQVNNGNFMPPSKFLNTPILKLHFVHPLQLNYYASSNETEVKIHIRKVMEGRFAAIYKEIEKTMNYIATPTDELLLINEFRRPVTLSLLEPLTPQQYSDRLDKLLTLQNIIFILIEKRKVWQKKSLQ